MTPHAITGATGYSPKAAPKNPAYATAIKTKVGHSIDKLGLLFMMPPYQIGIGRFIGRHNSSDY
jgi:hypothetical protein